MHSSAARGLAVIFLRTFSAKLEAWLPALTWPVSAFLQPPWHAARQGRLYKRVRVLLRYTAGTGLINQHYSHISAIALAATLGAELVLPPGVRP